MIKNLIRNWKTSSAGVTMIISSTVHLVFMVRHGEADETTWSRALTAIVGGLGLMAAGDAKLSAQKPPDEK